MPIANYKLAIFDLDGTILDTLDDLTGSVNYALSELCFPSRTKNEVRSFVGNGIHKLIERAVPQGTSEEYIEKAYDVFKKHYELHCADKTAPYNGITELLKELRKLGYKTAVVSNKADFAVKALCKIYFPTLFDCITGERCEIAKKPAPDSVNAVLKQLNILRTEAVYIGDSEVDIATAKNAEMPCISVSWGFKSKQYLVECGAKHIVNNSAELLKLLISE